MLVTASGSRSRSAAEAPRPRSIGTWVIIGVPAVLLLITLWQVGSGLLRTEIAVHDPVAVSRISLEPDPNGVRVDLVLVDRSGVDTTLAGDLHVRLREPDGAVWQTTRSVTADDFTRLPSGGLLAGRLGYSLVVPGSDWARAPRRGGAATVTVTVQPRDGTPFSSVADERFP